MEIGYNPSRTSSHRLDNDYFKFPSILFKDLITVTPFQKMLSYEPEYGDIKDFLKVCLRDKKNYRFDEDKYNVKKIVYYKDEGLDLIVYVVEGVFLKYSDNFIDSIDSIDFIESYINLPTNCGSKSIIVFSDILKEIMSVPRSFINYTKTKFDEESFADINVINKDFTYLRALKGIDYLIRRLYPVIRESSYMVPDSYRYRAYTTYACLYNAMYKQEDSEITTVETSYSEDAIKSIILSCELMNTIRMNIISPDFASEFQENVDKDPLFHEEPSSLIKKYKEDTSITTTFDIVELICSDVFNALNPLRKYIAIKDLIYKDSNKEENKN